MHSFLRITKRLFRFYLRYKREVSIYFTLLVLASIVANLQPFFFKAFVDVVTTNLDPTKLVLIVLGVAVVRFLTSGLVELALYFCDHGFLFKSVFDVHSVIFNHIQVLSFDFHQNKRSGSLISAMSRGQSAFLSYSANLIFNIAYFIVDFLFLVTLLFFINKGILLIMLATISLYLLFSYFIIKENVIYRNIANESDDKIKALIADNFINYETVKYYRQEEYEQSLFSSFKQEWVGRFERYTFTFRKFGIMNGLMSGIGMFCVLFVVIQGVIHHTISLGLFVLILSFITAFYQKLENVFFQLREIAKNYTDLEGYVNILDIPISMQDKENPKKLENIEGKVLFDHVTFAYKGRKPVLEDISFSINPRKTVALVGRSGAGKTTISKLLLRLYDVTDGSIQIDGVDIRDFIQHDLGHIVGLVPQEPLLFNQTIGYNIAYARPAVSLDEIKRAAQLAYLDTFIESLPEQYETEVGERGIKLSGGQKQRLAIARSIIQNPKILIFDEATSHLDSESEYYIQKALLDMAKDKTVIIIAHRLSTIMHADVIYVFEDGKIADQGSHEELINGSSTLYKKLWGLQSTGEL